MTRISLWARGAGWGWGGGLELFTLAWLAPCPVPTAGEAGGRLALGPRPAHSPEAFSLFLVFKLGYPTATRGLGGKAKSRAFYSVGQKLELDLDRFLRGDDATDP